jgi:type IV pilus assembly protein PilE
MKTRLKIPQGFTLIELMIAVVIIGILAAIAYPSFQSQLRKSRRADAKMALAELAQLQENFFVQNNSYAKNFNDLSVPGDFTVDESGLISKDGYYRIIFFSSSETSFIFRATAREGTTQEKDEEDCKTFSINHQGEKIGCW